MHWFFGPFTAVGVDCPFARPGAQGLQVLGAGQGQRACRAQLAPQQFGVERRLTRKGRVQGGDRSLQFGATEVLILAGERVRLSAYRPRVRHQLNGGSPSSAANDDSRLKVRSACWASKKIIP